MSGSLATRLYRTIFLVSLATIVLSMVTVEILFDDIEDRILSHDLASERDYFKDRIADGQYRHWETARLEVAFLPDGTSQTLLPLYLQNRPTPFTDEITVDGATYLILIEGTDNPPGRLFLAQDISTLESRESVVQIVLLAIALAMSLFTLIVARISSRHLVRPLKKLTREIHANEQGISTNRLSSNYRDSEFEEIATAFNNFLEAMESFVEREKSFVKLASHELRTPVTIISGALDVLEQRGSLTPADQRTLTRIRRATQTMKDDISALLELARGQMSDESFQVININQSIRDTIADIEHSQPGSAMRITMIDQAPDLTVLTEPAMVRMLVRNLLQNALRHTEAAIQVEVSDQGLQIRDFGHGLPTTIIERLSGPLPRQSTALQESSFGLLIVQLICERLNWTLDIPRTDTKGTQFLVRIPVLQGAAQERGGYRENR
ncbi:MAG: HAMP domain-containing sensor histidine kinase [Porticoccaceae bacterium]